MKHQVYKNTRFYEKKSNNPLIEVYILIYLLQLIWIKGYYQMIKKVPLLGKR